MNESRNSIRCGRKAAQDAHMKAADVPRESASDSVLRRATAVALVLTVTVSVTSLALGVAGKFGTGTTGDAAVTFPPRGFSDASAAAVSAIRENEALAVFLGWTEPNGAVPTGADADPDLADADAVPASVRTEDGIWLPDPPSPLGLGFWDYFAAAVARLLAP